MTFKHAALIEKIADAAHRLSNAAAQYACSAMEAAADREEYDRALTAFGAAHNALELAEKTAPRHLGVFAENVPVATRAETYLTSAGKGAA